MPLHQLISSRPSTTSRLGVKRLLTRALMAAALIGGTGAVLSAGSAEAATGCGEKISWVAWVGGQDLTCGDKVFSWESTAVLGNLGSSVVSAVQPNPGDYLFNLDFPDFTTNPFDFNYIASITDPTRFFSVVDLDSDANGLANPPSVLAATFTFADGNSPINLTSTNGSTAIENVTGNPITMTVRNNYDGNGLLTHLRTVTSKAPKSPARCRCSAPAWPTASAAGCAAASTGPV